MITLRRARTLALALPDAVEQDHHGVPSFRVNGRIFATQPDDAHFHLFLDETQTSAAIAVNPVACELLTWGRRQRGVRVALAGIGQGLLADLLADAWCSKHHAG